jgi:transcriptional regulator GlxA family with amidase domain
MSPADGFLKAVQATGMERKTIGIPLYPNFDSLDVLGPFQTFTMAADRLEPKLLAVSKAPVQSFEGVEITPHATFDQTKSLDVLFVPGGIKLEDVLKVGGPDQNPLAAFHRNVLTRDAS